MAGDERLKLEIDGAAVEPLTVPSRSALELAAAYLDVLERVARDRGADLSFSGIEIRNKCAELSFRPSAPTIAEEAAIEVGRYLRHEINPRWGTAGPTERLRRAIRENRRDGRTLRASIREWSQSLELAPEELVIMPESTITLRCKVMLTGGREPYVQVESGSEPDPFNLKASEDLISALGAHLYKHVDLVATVRRDENGKITGGRLLEFTPLNSSDPEAWFRWLDQNGRHWDDVTDVKGELGRD